jgi:hypothetical protein
VRYRGGCANGAQTVVVSEQLSFMDEIAPEPTGHSLPLSKCEANNRPCERCGKARGLGGIVKWEYRVALFRWRSDVWQEVNNMTDELDRALKNERRFDERERSAVTT